MFDPNIPESEYGILARILKFYYERITLGDFLVSFYFTGIIFNSLASLMIAMGGGNETLYQFLWHMGKIFSITTYLE